MRLVASLALALALALALPALADAPPASVKVQGFAFTPSDVTIPQHGNVTWTFLDGVEHTVTDTQSGTTWCGQVSGNCTRTFDQAGTFSYQCMIHPSMRGTVTVGSPAPATFDAPPAPAMSLTITDLHVYADASGSFDPDGNVTYYGWAWGDGAQSGGVKSTAAHDYASAGAYTVTLTVLDNAGRPATLKRDINVTQAPAANVPPVAAFVVRPRALNVTVDAGGSHDPDGAIVSYAWSFDDGANATGRVATHTFADVGDHVITLVVTDDRGGAAEANRTAHLAPPSAPPPAALALSSHGLQLDADASRSGTPDDPITIAWWAFGDGARLDAGAFDPARLAQSHVYARDGEFAVSVGVVDAWGFANATTASALIQGSPPAAFEWTASGLNVTLDASALPHYANASYAWTADGASVGAGPSVTWTAPSGGAHHVTLALADAAGTLSLTQDVTTSAPTTASTQPTPHATPTARGVDAPGAGLVVGLLAALAIAATRRQR